MPRIVSDIEQGTPEWYALRAGVLSASVFSDMLSKGRGKAPGLTRQALIYKLATERLTGRSAEDGYGSFYMERGKEREEQARALYTFQTGNAVDEVAFVFYDEQERIGCSPDGLVGDDGLVEIKAPKLSTHVGYLLNGGLPSEYRAQVQGQLMVTGRQWCDFCSYCPESNVELFRVRVERDQDYIADLIAACAKLIEETDAVALQLSELAA